MKCSDLQSKLTFYSDGSLPNSEASTIKAHLEACPLCRQKNAEYRELSLVLSQLARPDISSALQSRLKTRIRTELRKSETSSIAIHSDLREWFKMSVMPYGVGVAASLLIGFVVLSAMLRGGVPASEVASGTVQRSTQLVATNTDPFADRSSYISPIDFSNSRMAFANESPSLNPQGGLVAITKSLLRGEMKDDEVVVVADVFSNGLARISEVVESPRDIRTMSELEKALNSDPSFAPFVPAVMENRPENMRIVLKFKSVNVSTGIDRPAKRRS